jgi:hypothetical protein
MFYAGIGSRLTPPEMLAFMSRLSRYLYGLGYTLRSGGAAGADTAFEVGVPDPMKMEIYLPWKGFNGNHSLLYGVSNDALELAKQYHPGWSYLSNGGRLFHGRNCYQVLGKDLKTPSRFVVCWTKDGKAFGGTGQAIRIAIDKNIPIFNLRNPDEMKHVQDCMIQNKDFV